MNRRKITRELFNFSINKYNKANKHSYKNPYKKHQKESPKRKC